MRADKKIKVYPETWERVKELKKALEKVYEREKGKKKRFIYDDVVNILLDAFLNELPECYKEKERAEGTIKLLLSKLELARVGADGINGYEEALKLLFPITKDQLKRLSELADKQKCSTLVAFQQVVEIGLNHAGTVTYTLDEEEAEEYVKLLASVPEDKREKIVKDFGKTIETCFRRKLEMLKKKYKVK